MFYRFGYMLRFKRIQRSRHCFIYCTKTAMSRAGVTAEHKRCSFIGPAFENIRTLGLLANRMQVQAIDKFEDGVLIARVAQLDLQPVGLFESLSLFAIEKFLD